MKEITLYFRGATHYEPTIWIDGKIMRLKEKNGKKYVSYKTEEDYIELAVTKNTDMNSNFWILWQIIYLIISVFGLFDFGTNKKCLVMKSRVNIEAYDSAEIIVKINSHTKLDRVLEIESEGGYEELENEQYIDVVARRRVKIMRVIKVFIWIGLIIVICALAIKSNS